MGLDGSVRIGPRGAAVPRRRDVAASTRVKLDGVWAIGFDVPGTAIDDNAVDVVDDGTGNCWRNNSFTTGSVPPCP